MTIHDSAELFLPKYLNAEGTKRLFEELGSFPDNLDTRMYSSVHLDKKTVFQGDVIAELPLFDLKTQRLTSRKGIIISNTCDISEDNSRRVPNFVTWAPVLSLQSYRNALTSDGHKGVDDHIRELRLQRVTNILFLPSLPGLDDCFVRFDMAQSFSMDCIKPADLVSQRLASFSNYGFYLLVLKLSIHFSRVMECVDRG